MYFVVGIIAALCRNDRPKFNNWPPSEDEVEALVKNPSQKKGYQKLINWWKSIESEYRKKQSA